VQINCTANLKIFNRTVSFKVCNLYFRVELAGSLAQAHWESFQRYQEAIHNIIAANLTKYCTECTNSPLAKILYFSIGGEDLNQTFRIRTCIGRFTQDILQIVVKQQMWFNGYISLNVKVQFFK